MTGRTIVNGRCVNLLGSFGVIGINCGYTVQLPAFRVDKVLSDRATSALLSLCVSKELAPI